MHKLRFRNGTWLFWLALLAVFLSGCAAICSSPNTIFTATPVSTSNSTAMLSQEPSLVSGIVDDTNDSVLKGRMLAYMHERFTDDTFVYVMSMLGTSLSNLPQSTLLANGGVSTKYITVASTKFPDARITVSYTLTDDSAEIFNDNYLHFKYKGQTDAVLRVALGEVFGEYYKLSFGDTPSVGTNALSADATFEEYIASVVSQISFVVAVSPGYIISDADTIYNSLVSAFGVNNIRILNAVIYFCDDAQLFDSLNIAAVSKFQFGSAAHSLRLYQIGSEKAKFHWQ